MDIVLISLRLLHIVAGVAWFGVGLATAFFLLPVMIRAGDNGRGFLQTLVTTTPFGWTAPILSLLTVLPGLLLYIVGDAASHFTQTGNIVLGVGAVAGFLAGFYGGSVASPRFRRLNAAVSGAQTSETVIALQTALSSSRVQFALMLIALIGMGTARYL
jgi:hypothetical protein